MKLHMESHIVTRKLYLESKTQCYFKTSKRHMTLPGILPLETHRKKDTLALKFSNHSRNIGYSQG